MTTSLTSRLKLSKADPGTGEPVDVSKLNQNFDKIDAAVGPANVTSGTRPATPYANQLIRESDTRRGFVWNATQSSWDAIPVAGSTFPSQFDIERTTSGSVALTAKVTADTQNRLSINAAGQIDWGSGAAAADTNLYRAAANVLKTDDALQVTGTITSQSRPVTTTPTGTSGRIAWWSGTVTATGATPVTITHSAGFTPSAIAATQTGSGGTGLAMPIIMSGTETSTTVQVKFVNGAGNVSGSVALTLVLFA